MKTLTVEFIKEKIQTNDKWLYRALVRLFENQTLEEQSTENTSINNGIGFNSVDAGILSSFAKFYIKNGFLSEKQKIIARKKIKKYTKQLYNIAKQNNH